MKRYGAYKTSKEYWMEQIPSHWSENYIQQISVEKCEKNTGNQVDVVLSLSYGNIIRKKDVNSGLIAKDLATYQIVEPNDIILRFTDLQNDHRSLRTGLVKENGIITSAYTCIVTKINPSYLHYVLHAYDVRKIFYGMGGGVRQSIGFKDIRYMYVPVPPRLEQDQIVRYLDWKVSEVNRLVDIARGENKLLKEIIDEQFQKAKSSTVTKMKRIVSLEYDPINIKKDISYQKTGMYNRGRGIFRRDPVLGSEMGDSKFQKIHSGRIMISGQFAWEAAAYITTLEDEIGVASHRYYLLNPVDGFCAEYIWAFLMSDVGQMEMNCCSHGSAGRNRPLNIRELLNAEIPLPEYGKELDKLVKAVRAYMAYQSVLKNEESVLQEFKNRLIFDVVTGQIDVRDIEIPQCVYAEDMANNAFEDSEEFDETENEEV